MPKNPAVTYENRLILFLDFLGFKEIVDRTMTDSELLERVLVAIDEIGELADDSAFRKSQRVTQFSDSIVVSYHVNEESAVFWLLNQVAFCIINLVGMGFLVRGAITSGDMLHSDRYLIGPAMVRAYELESKHAKYPRVIVDPKVIDLARHNRRHLHTPKEEEEYVRSYLTNDYDGRLYYNYVSWDSVVNVAGLDDYYYPEYIARIGKIVECGLAHSDPTVCEKYLWLHKQYVSSLDLIKKLPTDNPYPLENAEICEAIDGLPKLNKLSHEAAERVNTVKKSKR